MLAHQYILPRESPRKWLRFVAIHGLYEKAVKVCKDMPKYEYYGDLYLREVMTESIAFNGAAVTVNGYFRLRTDNEYYPICGKYGIPDGRLSGLAKDFIAHQRNGQERGRHNLWMKKMEGEGRRLRIKAADDYKHARNIPRCDLAARLGIPTSLATDEILEAKRNQIATLRAIKQIKKITDENKSNETN